ncbi:acyl-CoA N-acyltransferase [Biscogniauxia mediterranea]|nr:acyl-CoA N-acyltransferase [Biscogniauxia mediterranea]
MSRATESDLDDLIDAYYEAFRLDPGNTYWWSPDRGHMQRWLRHRILKKMNDRSFRHFKISDGTTGDLVAWARWNIPEGYDAHFGPHVDGQGDEIMGGGGREVDVSRIVEEEDRRAENGAPVGAVAPLDYPEGGNPAFCREFFGAIQNMSEKWGAKKMLGLSLLCTAPKYHRRGAAKALLLPMLAIADAAGLRTYLEATPTGRPVYEKLGFRTLDEIEFDLSTRIEGYGAQYKLSIMVREPGNTHRD